MQSFVDTAVTQFKAEPYDDDMWNMILTISFGVIFFINGFVPLIFRFTAWEKDLGSKAFSVINSFSVTYELMWILHLILWGYLTVILPLLFIPNMPQWFVDYFFQVLIWGGNWGGAALAAILFTFFLISVAEDESTPEILTVVMYPIMMTGNLFVTWYFIDPVIEYVYGYTGHPIPEKTSDPTSAFVDDGEGEFADF